MAGDGGSEYRSWPFFSRRTTTCLDIRNCILIYDNKNIYEDVLQRLETFYLLHLALN